MMRLASERNVQANEVALDQEFIEADFLPAELRTSSSVSRLLTRMRMSKPWRGA